MRGNHQIIHPSFKLNGHALKKDDIKRIACNLVKEGTSNQNQLGLFLLDWLDDHPKITLKTSGTTGAPKEIVVEKQAMINSAKATGEFFNLPPETTCLCCMPVNFIAGKMMIVRALVLGWHLDVIDPSANPLERIEKKYDFSGMTPMQVENVLDKIHLIGKIIIGGAKLPEDLAQKLKQKPTICYETYASTETLTHIAAKRIEEDNFRLLPGISISQDSRGCLLISAPRISDSQIITNDLVIIHPDNSFTWLGRIDNVINSGGIKLFPEKIEEKLQTQIKHKFFVGGISDSYLGEKLILVIQSKPYDIPQNLFDSLDKYEKPKEVYFLEKFIETESGKIKRKEILEFIEQQLNKK